MGQPTLARPNDRRTALVDPDLPIDPRDVIAHSRPRQGKCFRNRCIVGTLTDHSEHLLLAWRQLGDLLQRCAGLLGAQISELLDHIPAKPVGVAHYRLDRRNKFKLGMAALSDVLDHPQDAWVTRHINRRGRDEAVEQLTTARSGFGIGIAQTSRPLDLIFEPSAGRRSIPQHEVARHLADQRIVVVAGHCLERLVGVEDLMSIERGDDHRDRG